MPSLVILPKLTYEMEEGRILEWLCQEGDAVSSGQPLLVVETDKAAVEVPAEQTGTLLRILVPAGETVAISSALAWIGAPGEAVPEGPARPGVLVPAVATPAITAVPARAPGRVQVEQAAAAPAVAASPAARRLARELGVDLAAVQVLVGEGRIREADVQAFADRRSADAAVPGHLAPKAAAAEEFELVEPTPLQRAMAGHLTRAAAIPQSAAVGMVELTALERLRSELLDDWGTAHGFRLTLTHMLAALVTRALGTCRLLNASWTDEGIRVYRHVNLGVAMATGRGLVVPVVQHADERSLADLAAEIVRLQHAAEHNRLAPGDLEGGTFTVTNVGMLGITISIPVLNPPQSAIVGIGARQLQPMLVEGELKNVAMMAITLVADHRVVDGAASGAFLREVKGLIESPRDVLAPGWSGGLGGQMKAAREVYIR